MAVTTEAGVLVLSVDVRGEERVTDAALEVLDRLTGLDLYATWSTTDAELAGRVAIRHPRNEVSLASSGPLVASRGEFSRQLTIALAAFRGVGRPITSLVIEGPLAHADLIAERGLTAVRTTPTPVRGSIFPLVSRTIVPAPSPEIVKGGLTNVPATCLLGGKAGRKWLASRATQSVPSTIGQAAADGTLAHLVVTLDAQGAASAVRGLSPVLALVQALVDRGMRLETVSDTTRRLAASRVRPGARGSILRAA
jgi:hypothetical protein